MLLALWYRSVHEKLERGPRKNEHLGAEERVEDFHPDEVAGFTLSLYSPRRNRFMFYISPSLRNSDTTP
jgi:hypothetical protein